MNHVGLDPRELATFYQETSFLQCYVHAYTDDLGQATEQLTVVGKHRDLGLVTIIQNSVGALLISDHCYRENDAMWNSDDLEMMELAASTAFKYALTKAAASDLLVTTIDTSDLVAA